MTNNLYFTDPVKNVTSNVTIPRNTVQRCLVNITCSADDVAVDAIGKITCMKGKCAIRGNNRRSAIGMALNGTNVTCSHSNQVSKKTNVTNIKPICRHMSKYCISR